MVTFACFLFPVPQLLCGQEECTQCLVEQEASVLLADSRGLTSIHLAAACGHASWLVELLSIACSELSSLPPLRDHRGYTPLHWACHFGTVPVLWSPVCLRLCFKDSKCPLRVHCPGSNHWWNYIWK